ncbi:MAG: hypothetical protein KIS92_16255 [Planctomycetota bacterium]|nr:hypothetical protein [Planctomycetota bacterium]
MRRCWLLFLIAAVGPALSAAEVAQTPQPSVTAETVKALAEKLGADAFEDREAAEAELLRMGEPAWPFLESYLTDERDEVARRTARLSDKIAVVLERDAEKAKAFLALLRDRDDEMKRAQGIDGMMTLGRGGIRAARLELAGAGTKIEVKLECVETVIPPETKVELKATAASVGEGRFWIGAQASPLHVYAYDVQPFGEVRDGFGTRHSGRSVRVRRSGYYNPIRAWRVCHPGPLESASHTFEAKAPGVYQVFARCIIRQETISPRLPGTEATPIDFVVNGAVGKDMLETRVTKQVCAVPEVDKLPADPRLALEAARTKTQRPAAAGGAVPITLTFRSKHGKPLQIEQDMLRWAWFCWIGEKDHRPATWGSLHTAVPLAQDGDGEEKEVDALATFTMPAGGTVERNLHIPAPPAAGTYRLLIGYEVTRENMLATPVMPLDLNADTYDEGRHAVELKNIVLEPAPKAETAAPEKTPAK